MFLFLQFKCSVTILLFARNKWLLNKRRTRITKNLIKVRIVHKLVIYSFISVVVQFRLWFNLFYSFFWGILFRYDNEFEKREIKFKTRTKLNYSGSSRGVKTCETHEWRKTINTKKPLTSQHNRAKGNNCLNKHPREDARLRGASSIGPCEIVPGAEKNSNRCNMYCNVRQHLRRNAEQRMHCFRGNTW